MKVDKESIEERLGPGARTRVGTSEGEAKEEQNALQDLCYGQKPKR